MAKTSRKRKEKKLHFCMLNIKLLSNYRKNTAGYAQLIRELYEKRVMKQVGSTEFIILRTQFQTAWKENEILYGNISRFTKIEGKSWLNIQNMQVEDHDPPENIFPNLRETIYVFVPFAHRLVIINSAKLNINIAYRYFKQALKEVIGPDEQYDVTIEQSSDVFDQIISAKEILKLEIDISYSNADISKKATKYMDNQLRAMNAGKFKMVVEPDQHEKIEVEKSDILKGALGVAQSNGGVKAAIIDINGEKKKIVTIEHPRTETITVGTQEELNSTISKIVQQISKIFRRGRIKNQ